MGRRGRRPSQRALLNVILEGVLSARGDRVELSAERADAHANITVLVENAATQPLPDPFEPFPAGHQGCGLTLATARRLIENQGGTVRAEWNSDRVRFLVRLPLARNGTPAVASRDQTRGLG